MDLLILLSQPYFSAGQRSCRKANFSVMSVNHSIHKGIPIQCPSPRLPHCPWPQPHHSHTGPHDLSHPSPPTCSDLYNLDLTVQGPHPTNETCSNLFTMKHKLLEAGGCHSIEIPPFCFVVTVARVLNILPVSFSHLDE